MQNLKIIYMDDSEYFKRWNKYLLYMDLYKFFHSMTINTMIFSSAVVGGLFAFYIQNQSLKNSNYILLIISIVLFIISALAVVSADIAGTLNKRIKELSVEFKITPYPSTIPLKYILISASILCFVLAIEVLVLFW